MWIFEVDSSIGKIQLSNVHLCPPLETETSMGFLYRALFTSPKIRLKEIKSIFTYLKPHLPTVIAGDFNEGNTGYTIYYLMSQNYIDALKATGIKGYTWQWLVYSFYLRARLDHVFSNLDLDPVQSQIIYEGNSDHFPVIVDFKRIR
ncbi:hypothetical protein EP47_07725 [Legionella norrlandica]|uniref:Endonuclease/exonuclease/phosphatase domain-containing protein n=1 Tax=Legionella norrlandica TaxID=1498499 RepID=A0A0A2SU27_9GAMM|nr:endonuclease/exonuclease/phosphatase family protein [Legionella norrlandica]KGP62884.1 hypothetical protein EP47_07725 [Legionella norrlandica]